MCVSVIHIQCGYIGPMSTIISDSVKKAVCRASHCVYGIVINRVYMDCQAIGCGRCNCSCCKAAIGLLIAL
jgi:hypothetical protein